MRELDTVLPFPRCRPLLVLLPPLLPALPEPLVLLLLVPHPAAKGLVRRVALALVVVVVVQRVVPVVLKRVVGARLLLHIEHVIEVLWLLLWLTPHHQPTPAAAATAAAASKGALPSQPRPRRASLIGSGG